MKIWVISGEGMPIYGYWTTEEKAREAWTKYKPNYPNLNEDTYGAWVHYLECEDGKDIEE